jgi:hypothetical protein
MTCCQRRSEGVLLQVAQFTLSASVAVADDIPILRAVEFMSEGGNAAVRAYRLDTVEDDEVMTSSLQMPAARGVLPCHPLHGSQARIVLDADVYFQYVDVKHLSCIHVASWICRQPGVI